MNKRSWREVLAKTDPAVAQMPVTLHAAQRLIMLGHRIEAAKAMMELIERYPDDLQAVQQLAALFRRIGRPDDANRMYLRAAEVEARQYSDQAASVTAIASFLAAADISSAPPPVAPAAFVEQLFDRNAARFDDLLRNSLEYKAPEILLEACLRTDCFGSQNLESKKAAILDLGCGTGLTGEIFRPHAQTLHGVDLSANMLEVAEQKKVYDELHKADLVSYMKASARQYQLILAADVFIYMGELAPAIEAAHNRLGPSGCLAFTIELSAEADFSLQAVRRYSHSRNYLEQLATKFGYRVRHFEEAAIRQEALRPVPSCVVIFEKTQN